MSGMQAGDVLIAVNGQGIQSESELVTLFHPRRRAKGSITRCCGCDRGDVTLAVAPMPNGFRALYFALAAVGIFSLLVGASVRLRRPEHQATLHFFWLSVAFFGVLTFSFSGRLDTLDRVFYWATWWRC